MRASLTALLFTVMAFGQGQVFPGGSSAGGTSGGTYCPATGSASNTLVCTGSPVPSSYTAGMVVSLNVDAANTGATTLNISSLGAKNVLLNGSALSASSVTSGNTYLVAYDGTQFNLQSMPARPSCDDSGVSAGSLYCGGLAPSDPFAYISWNVGSVKDGTCTTNTAYLQNASVGDFGQASATPPLVLGMSPPSAQILASGVVTLYICNQSGAAITVPPTVFKVGVHK